MSRTPFVWSSAGLARMFDSASILKPGLRQHVPRLRELHAVEARVVLARDADVVDDAEHAARLQRVVDAFRERDGGRLAVLPVVEVVQDSAP